MSTLRKIYYRLVKRYRRLEFKSCTYAEADRLIKATYDKPEADQWVIATEEDRNFIGGMVGLVFLERRERITS